MKPGSRCTDWPSAVCWLASAVVVWDRFETRLERSAWRVAMSDTSPPVLTRNCVNLAVSRLSSENSMLLAAIAGLRYWYASCAFAPEPAYSAADPWITFWSALRVGGVNVLNS